MAGWSDALGLAPSAGGACGGSGRGDGEGVPPPSGCWMRHVSRPATDPQPAVSPLPSSLSATFFLVRSVISVLRTAVTVAGRGRGRVPSQ